MQSTIGTTFDVGITTLTDVDAISRIAYDIRDMAESLEQGEWVTGKSTFVLFYHMHVYVQYEVSNGLPNLSPDLHWPLCDCFATHMY